MPRWRWVFVGLGVGLPLLVLGAFAAAASQLHARVAGVNWRYQPPQATEPMFELHPGADGSLAAVDWQHGLYALDASGQVTAQAAAEPGDRFGKGVQAPDGTLYLGSHAGKVYAFDAHGARLWCTALPDVPAAQLASKGHMTCPALGPDGKLYVFATDGRIAILNRDGAVERQAATGVNLWPMSPPAFAPGGDLYIAEHNKAMLRVGLDGKVRWRQTFPCHDINCWAASSDGTLFLVAHQDKFYALNPDGTTRWTYANHDPLPNNGFHWYDFALRGEGANQQVLVISDGRLAAFRPDGTLLWEKPKDGGMPLLAGQRLFERVTQLRPVSSANNWLFWHGWGQPKLAQFDPALLELDPQTGRELHAWTLPENLEVTLIDPAENAAYGYRSTKADFNAQYELLKVELH